MKSNDTAGPLTTKKPWKSLGFFTFVFRIKSQQETLVFKPSFKRHKQFFGLFNSNFVFTKHL